MPHGNAHKPRFAGHLTRRACLTAAALLVCMPALAQEGGGKKKGGDPNKPPERPPVNSPLLLIEAVTAPVAGPPTRTIIMTFTIDCGSVEMAQQVDPMIARVYNAVIMELNREPLGRDGQVQDSDLEALKRRLLFQINRALKGPTVAGVYIRSLQEVPRRG